MEEKMRHVSSCLVLIIFICHALKKIQFLTQHFDVAWFLCDVLAACPMSYIDSFVVEEENMYELGIAGEFEQIFVSSSFFVHTDTHFLVNLSTPINTTRNFPLLFLYFALLHIVQNTKITWENPWFCISLNKENNIAVPLLDYIQSSHSLSYCY